MATKSIGATGRDYATLALYASYLDGLDTLSAAELGEMYNDGEFSVAGTVMTLTGFTPSASNTVTIRPASGQGFKDASGALTDDQQYDQTRGVAIKRTTNYGHALDLGSIQYVTLQGVQIRGDGGNAGAFVNAAGTIDSCIIEDYRGCNLTGADAVLSNSVFVSFANAISAPIVLQSGSDVVNSSILRPSDVSGAGVDAIQISYTGGSTLLNVNVFGFANAVVVVSGSVTSTTCYTDDATPPTGFTQVTYSNQFEATTSSGRDWRTKSGADIIGAGTASGAPSTDMLGQTRPSPPSVGHFELVTATASTAFQPDAFQSTAFQIWGKDFSGGGSIASGALSVSGVATATFTGASTYAATISIAGVAAASFTGASTAEGVLSVAGVGAASFTGAALVDGALSAAGVAAVSFEGAALAGGALSIAGVATVSFTGASIAEAAFTSAGVGAASFAGASTAEAAISIAGIAAASFVGDQAGSNVDGVLSIAGVATADFTGAAVVEGALSAAGVAAAAFTGASIAEAILTAAGAATVAFTAPSVAEGAFTMAAGASVLFVGLQIGGDANGGPGVGPLVDWLDEKAPIRRPRDVQDDMMRVLDADLEPADDALELLLFGS